MSLCRLDVVAVDFLGHGDSKAPNQPELYTEEEVSLVLFIKNKSLCQLREEERMIFHLSLSGMGVCMFYSSDFHTNTLRICMQ